MNASYQAQWKRHAIAIVNSAKYWLWIWLLVTLVLFVIDSAPFNHLGLMLAVGVLWGGLIVVAWRYCAWWLFGLLFIYLKVSATIAERMYPVHGQVEAVQGVTLAASVTGIFMALFSSHVIRYIKLTPERKNVAEQGGASDR